MHSRPAGWLPVSIAPSDADLEVCALDYDGIVHALARSYSVLALAASASLNNLRASRSAGVITFRSNVSLILNP
jgi:hypothetical protein